jgi:hypothetical protein
MNPEQLQAYLDDAVFILRQSLDLYQAGQTAFYRVAAVELRLLLCDTTRQHGRMVEMGLLPRFCPHLQLPAVDEQAQLIESGPVLDLPDWLSQPIQVGERKMSVRRLIRQVCDQDGGAHVDSRRREGLPPASDYREQLMMLGKVVLTALQNGLD